MTNSLYPTGTSILEVIIATTLVSIALVALLSLSTRSQQSADYSKNNNQATNYSYQVVDWLRDLKFTIGWSNLIYYLQDDAGSLTSLTYCLNDSLPISADAFSALTIGACSSEDTLDDFFSRQLYLDWSAGNSLTGTVTTSWQEQTERSNTIQFELNQW